MSETFLRSLKSMFTGGGWGESKEKAKIISELSAVRDAVERWATIPPGEYLNELEGQYYHNRR